MMSGHGTSSDLPNWHRSNCRARSAVTLQWVRQCCTPWPTGNCPARSTARQGRRLPAARHECSLLTLQIWRLDEGLIDAGQRIRNGGNREYAIHRAGPENRNAPGRLMAISQVEHDHGECSGFIGEGRGVPGISPERVRPIADGPPRPEAPAAPPVRVGDSGICLLQHKGQHNDIRTFGSEVGYLAPAKRDEIRANRPQNLRIVLVTDNVSALSSCRMNNGVWKRERVRRLQCRLAVDERGDRNGLCEAGDLIWIAADHSARQQHDWKC